MLFLFSAIVLLTLRTSGHAAMYEPPTRNSGGMNLLHPGCTGASCLWFTQGTWIGCRNATGEGNIGIDCLRDEFVNGTHPTLPHEMRTFNMDVEGGVLDWSKRNPWRAPGSAPQEDPCGLAGGWYSVGKDGYGGQTPPGYTQGQRGSRLPKLLEQTVWNAGEDVEVAFSIYANHGGGYQYRLCPAGEPLTEGCFQRLPLEFVGDEQWIQFGWGMDPSNRTSVKARRTSVGTTPKGSTWTRNPVPACGENPLGGAMNSPYRCVDASGALSTQFPSPDKERGVYGFGGAACQVVPSMNVSGCTTEQYLNQAFDFGVVDRVRVPADLRPGDYVLQFRWDAEQSPQIWSNCADITVQPSSAGPPSAPFSPMNGCEPCCDLPGGHGICANCTACADTKTGDCEYCWKPLPGFNAGLYPHFTCLGNEAADGGSPGWLPGNKMGNGWSPGCPKCWNSPDSCKPRLRPSKLADL